MKIENYSGICRACMCPINTGDEISLHHEEVLFHKLCVKNHPDSHYIALERIEKKFEDDSENLTELMDEMERIFKIPALNDPEYNDHNKDVISLYRRISSKRKI